MKKKCVICGAKIRNLNPKTNTCSPECTAKKNGDEPPDPKFKTCPGCGIAIYNWEDNCGFCDNQDSWIETNTYR